MSGTSGKRRRGLYPMLWVFGGIAAAYLAMAGMVIAVDPYDLYPWGVRPTLTTRDSAREASTHLVNVVAKTPDLGVVMVGSSTTGMYTSDRLKQAFPGEGMAYNLSYAGPRPGDRDLVLRRIVEEARPKRAIIGFDWMYIRRAEDVRPLFPAFLYDEDLGNDLRMVDLKGVRQTLAFLRGRAGYDYTANYARYRVSSAAQYDRYQSPATMRKLAVLIDRQRASIDRPSGRTCADMDAVAALASRAKALAARGTKVDILIPVYSYAFYYEWQAQISPTLLDEELIARRCLVEAVDGVPGVRVFALDLIPGLADDMGNYRDSGHLFTQRYLDEVIQSVAQDRNRLTRANIAAYCEGLRTAVKSYRLTNSRLPNPADDTGRKPTGA